MLFAAAAAGFTAVALGAFAAHGLADRLPADRIAIFETGARYHAYHALALLGAAGLRPPRPRARTAAAACFAAGIVVFSGSLYLLAVTGARWLGAVTPVGGLLFLTGWFALGVSALGRRTTG